MSANEQLPPALRKLADILPLSRQGNAYHLLLTSSISLTPALLGYVCGTSDWETFRQYIQELGFNGRMSVLTHYLREIVAEEGYRALADLIRDGYFSTILTTNIDTLLEEALIKAGVSQSDMQVLLVGRDQPSYIADMLANTTGLITILKLYGGLKERVLPDDFPDVLAFLQKVEELLAKLLDHDLVIVGNLEHELAIQRLLPVKSKCALYNVQPSLLDHSHNYLVRVMEARNLSPSSFIINGPQGNFHTFFPALRSRLQLQPSTITEVPPARISPPSQVPHRRPSEAGDMSKQASQADVLLVTATLIEARAVLNMHKNRHQSRFDARNRYHDLGVIGGARVALVLQSSMGAGGLGGARFTVYEGIQTLHPSAVIMVGIACGLQPGQQRPGDILVSEHLVSYEPQRIGTQQHTAESLIHHRGERVPASARTLGLFKNGSLLLNHTAWPQPPQIFFGPVLSGDKLLDNIGVREALLQQEPKAIGLEMEGIGLYEVATRAYVDWLLVKAISDWGDGKKSEYKEQHQELAAENAARFTLEIIAQGGFAYKAIP